MLFSSFTRSENQADEAVGESLGKHVRVNANPLKFDNPRVWKNIVEQELLEQAWEGKVKK